MAMIHQFYMVAETMARIQKELPAKFRTLIYDPRFTSETTIEEYKKDQDLSAICIPDFYEYVFKELDDIVRQFNCLTYVCCSEDINEPIERGEFDYYCGMVSSNVGIIYMRASHPWALPSRALIYGPAVQIFVSNDTVDIEASPTNEDIYNKLMVMDDAERAHLIKEFLITTDRPLLDPSFK